MPTVITAYAAVTLADGQTALLCGGRNETDFQHACYYYFSENDTWTSALSMNVARATHGMALYKHKVYVYGGTNATGDAIGSVEVLADDGEWQVLPFGMCQICDVN